MQKTTEILTVWKHAPTLKTILMVEDTLQKSNESTITFAELKRQLPRQVNHNTLKAVLEYLEDSNKIVFGLRGITWVGTTSPRLMKSILEGSQV